MLSIQSLKNKNIPYGSTDLRSPAIELEFADGTSATDFRYVDYKIVDGKPALEGLPATYVEADKEAQTLIITLTDKVKMLMQNYPLLFLKNIMLSLVALK